MLKKKYQRKDLTKQMLPLRQRLFQHTIHSNISIKSSKISERGNARNGKREPNLTPVYARGDNSVKREQPTTFIVTTRNKITYLWRSSLQARFVVIQYTHSNKFAGAGPLQQGASTRTRSEIFWQIFTLFDRFSIESLNNFCTKNFRSSKYVFLNLSIKFLIFFPSKIFLNFFSFFKIIHSKLS